MSEYTGLGKKCEDKTRPVIMRLYGYNEKVTICKNCGKLNGSDISIANDLSQAILQRQRKLWESTKAERARGMKVKLVHDRIAGENKRSFGMTPRIVGLKQARKNPRQTIPHDDVTTTRES